MSWIFISDHLQSTKKAVKTASDNKYYTNIHMIYW